MVHRKAIALAIVFLCTVPCLADTIYFKDGKKLDATIIEKTDKYIKVDVAGIPLTYFNDEIEKIVAGQAKEAVAQSANTLDAGRKEFVSQDYGIRIIGPEGWTLATPASGPQIAIFKKSLRAFPLIGITVDTVPPQIKSAIEFAKWVLPSYQEPGVNFRILEEPHVVIVNGLEAAKFTFEMSDEQGRSMKSLDYKFMMDTVVFSVQCMDYPQAFAANLKDFEDAVATFKFIGEGKRVAESGQTRKRKLSDVLAAGQKQYGQYEHATPKFVLKIPEGTSRNWHFVVFNEPTVPFYLVNDATFIKDIPFISSMVSEVPPEKLRDKETAFKEVAEFHREWEKEVWGKGIVFVNNGSPLELKGFSAFERIVEVPNKKLNYHFVYIFIGDYLLQLGLNTRQEDYANDDKDFMRILATLSTQ